MMKSLDVPQHLLETYLSLLRNLSSNSKLELISALSLSMKNEQPANGLAKTLFGVFETNKSAEQIIEEVKQSRYFNRKVEKL